MKWPLIRENPLAEVVAGSQSNQGEAVFRDAAVHDQRTCSKSGRTKWKLLFALMAASGGLRSWEHCRPLCFTRRVIVLSARTLTLSSTETLGRPAARCPSAPLLSPKYSMRNAAVFAP